MISNGIKFLCNQTELKAGIKVLTFSDAERLSYLLKSEKHNISAHTIARLFGVISETRKHYRNTLSILANYIGFKDYDHFIMSYQSGYFNPLYADYTRDYDQFMILLELYATLNDFENIFVFIENMNQEHRQSCTFKIAHLLGKLARQNNYSEQFIHSIKAFRATNDLFLNTWIDEDYLNQGYMNYLRSNLQPENSDLSVFVQTLELTSAVYSKISSKNIDFNIPYWSANPHILSRQLEVLLLGMGLSNKPLSEILDKIEKEIHDVNPNNQEDLLWIIGRSLRACAYLGIWKDLKKLRSFNKIIESVLNREKSNLNSIGEGIVQAYAMYADLEYNLLFLPQSDVLNEQRNKHGLNALFLYKSSTVHTSELQTTLKQLSDVPNMAWIKGCF